MGTVSGTPHDDPSVPPGGALEVGLEELLLEIRPPVDYFRGLSPSEMPLPVNVLLFHRTLLNQRGRAHHHRYVLIFSLRKTAQVIVDDLVVGLEPGHALLVFPHQYHYYQADKEAHYAWLFVTFELEGGVAPESLRGRALPFGPGQRSLLLALVRQWLEPQATGRAARVCLLTALLLQDLVAAAAQGQDPATVSLAAFDRVLSGICRYIQEHLREGLRIKGLARSQGLSESHLRLLFRRRMGVSLGRYLLNARMQRATRLLTGSTLAIQEIARSCGYGTPYAFSRAFKNEMRMTPLAFRRRHAAG